MVEWFLRQETDYERMAPGHLKTWPIFQPKQSLNHEELMCKKQKKQNKKKQQQQQQTMCFKKQTVWTELHTRA